MSSENSLVVRLETADLDTGELHIFRLKGHERISQLFSFELDLLVPGEVTVDHEQLIGADASLVFEHDGNITRTIHGMLASITEIFDFEDKRQAYRFHLVPRAHRMTLIETQDVFLDTSVPELIRDKLNAVGLLEPSDQSSTLLGQYAQREFIVQFEESDLAFISRLAEHLGIAFYFDQSQGADRIVFVDNNNGFSQLDGCKTILMCRRDDEVGCHRLQATTKVIPKQYVMMEYNYRTPDLELTSHHSSDHGYAGGIVEWGSHFKTPDEGDSMAKIRSEERECRKRVYEGNSNVHQISAGYHYTLEGHPTLEGKSLLMTEVHHEGHWPIAHYGSSEELRYQNTFKATPMERTFRPQRLTPKPRIHGLLTGVVEPREYDEVERYARIDEHGRYVIKFFYDSAPLGERQASRPVRKAQPTVGADYGMHFPLRPGIEVVMAFVNGDPDRPIVVGAVHNTRTPAHVTRSESDYNRLKTVSGIIMQFKDN